MPHRHDHGGHERAAHGDAGQQHGPHLHGAGAHGEPRPGGGREAERGRLWWVLGLTGMFMVAEVVGGLLSGSLALLADAGHMFTDVAAIALSLAAMGLARRPPSPDKTYGYVRLEILAALVNGAALLVMAGFIVWEAWERLNQPVEVDATILLGVAGGGLLVNVAGALLLHRHAGSSLNVRGAYLHVLGDLLGSIGALLAGAIILVTGWYPADPLVSVAIALLILTSAWRLVKEATDVLLEAAPAHVDVGELRRELGAIPRLHDVHDLHVWTLTSGFVALSGHGVVEDPAHHRDVLAAIQERVRRLGIEHITFQLEPRELYQIPPRGRRPGRPPPRPERSRGSRPGSERDFEADRTRGGEADRMRNSESGRARDLEHTGEKLPGEDG